MPNYNNIDSQGHATPDASGISPERVAFFNALGWESGHVEVVAGTNHPTNPDRIDLLVWDKTTYRTKAPNTRRWIASDNLAALNQHINYTAERWGNAYLSVGTYGQAPNLYKPGKTRPSRDVPLPRPTVWLDDVYDLDKLRLRPTIAVETSPGSFQVGYRCDELLSPRWAAMLGEGAQRLEGTDPSGSDATQLIRVPGTLNTKYKCIGRAGDPAKGIEPEGWRVRLVWADGPRYSVQTLADNWLPCGMSDLRGGGLARKHAKPSNGSVGDIGHGSEDWRQQDWRESIEAQTALWRPLVRTGRGGLLADPGHPRAFKNPRAVARRNWDGHGTGDQSRDIFIVAKGLLLHGYDDAQATALLEHFAYTKRPHYAQRGAEQVFVDICRVLWTISVELGESRKVRHAELPVGVQPQAGPTTPRIQPKRGPKPGGRNAQVSELHAILSTLPADTNGWAHTTRATLAEKLCAAPSSLSRYLSDLRNQGWDIRTEATGIAAKQAAAPDAISDKPSQCLPDAISEKGYQYLPDAISEKGYQLIVTDGVGTRNNDGLVQGDHTRPILPVAPAAPAQVTGGCDLPVAESATQPDDAPSVAEPEPITESKPFDLREWLQRCKDAPLPPLPPPSDTADQQETPPTEGKHSPSPEPPMPQEPPAPQHALAAPDGGLNRDSLGRDSRWPPQPLPAGVSRTQVAPLKPKVA